MPLFIISASTYYKPRPYGILADVAPTVLHLLGLELPQEMEGRTLIEDSRPL